MAPSTISLQKIRLVGWPWLAHIGVNLVFGGTKDGEFGLAEEGPFRKGNVKDSHLLAV